MDILSADIQYIKANIIPIALTKKKFHFYLFYRNKYPNIINEIENLWPSNEANKDPAIIRRIPKTKKIY